MAGANPKLLNQEIQVMKLDILATQEALINSFSGNGLLVRLQQRTGIVHINFSRTLARKVKNGIKGIFHPTDGSDHAYVSRLRWMGYLLLPSNLLLFLDLVRSGDIAPTAVLFAGLPFDRVVWTPSPRETIRDRKPTDLSENLLAMVAALLGEPYSIFGEGPRLINDLWPTIEDKQRLTGRGSELDLAWHIENAYARWSWPGRDLAPSSLLLGGVCAPPNGGPYTRITNGRMAATSLWLKSRQHYQALFEVGVTLAPPLRHRRNSTTSHGVAAPVLSGPFGMEMVSAVFYGDSDMMVPLSPAIERALAAYRRELDVASVCVRVLPGVIVYVPNSYTLHGRDGFSPCFDAEQRVNRWIQRVFVTNRLDSFQIGMAHSDRVFELPRV